MPSLREIKRRIRTVTSTAQITKALEMVSTSKMRRAQQMVLASRPYSEKMRDVLADLATQATVLDTPLPLLQKRPVRKTALVLFTADRGMAGALNTNILRQAAEFIRRQSTPVVMVTVGRKGRDWMVRQGQEIVAEFTHLGDRPTYDEIIPVARVVDSGYVQGLYDEVHVLYTQYVSTMTQRPTSFQLLPVQPPSEWPGSIGEYIYEPSPEEVLRQLLPRFVEVQLYQTLVETVASEHSARMVAMRNATENANDITVELTLRYNKARQETITKEIVEIASGAEALA